MLSLPLYLFQASSTCFTIIFGICLPIAALGIELTSHMCGSVFFDPIPENLHVLLISLVPAASLYSLVRLRSANEKTCARLLFLGGVALAVSLVYSLLFLPVTPLAAFAILFYGIGLLALAPALSILALLLSLARNVVRHNIPLKTVVRYSVSGALVGLTSFALAEVPAILTRVAMTMADSDTVTDRSRGLRLLRNFGDEETMRANCFTRVRRFGELLPVSSAFGGSTDPESARKIYYRIFGEDCTRLGWPLRSSPQAMRLLSIPNAEALWFDEELRMETSKLNVDVDAASGTTYTEWVFSVRNHSIVTREARAQIQLPPEGVVSRVTLWVNGQEREAVFGERKQVQAAYERVVNANRDPVLVTSAGPDRVNVRLFPVLPEHGEMKVRIGISSPLALTADQRAVYRLPSIIESNFYRKPDLKHEVWIDSRHPMQSLSEDLKNSSGNDGRFNLRGTLSDKDLPLPTTGVIFDSGAVSERVWTYDPLSPEQHLITQDIDELQHAEVERLIFVVDGSASTSEFLPTVGAALLSVPADLEVAVVLAGETAKLLEGPVKGQSEMLKAAAYELTRYSYSGWTDNVEALELATQQIEKKNTAVIWVHGPSEVALQELPTRLERAGVNRPAAPIYSIQTSPGPNRLTEFWEGPVVHVSRTLTFENDLLSLVALVTGQNGKRIYRRARKPLQSTGVITGWHEASAHVARLWANARVLELKDGSAAEAALTAGRYKIVTPVSGAVVLETDEQYTAAGLETPTGSMIPTIPEPETYLLMMIVLAISLKAYARRVQSCNATQVSP